MINLFKQIKESKEVRKNVSDIITNYVGGKLHQFAIYLSKKTQNMRPGIVAAYLLILCLVGFIALSVQSFYSFKQESQITFQSINTPAMTPHYPLLIDTIILHRIKYYHRQLDSLKQNNFLRYDSIMKCRPHLLDSIITVEQLTIN